MGQIGFLTEDESRRSAIAMTILLHYASLSLFPLSFSSAFLLLLCGLILEFSYGLETGGCGATI